MSSLLATLALALGLAAGSSPDERIVCVPSEDGKGWDCGRGASAPAPRSLPREHSRPAPSAPPPYLMDPSRIPSVAGQSLGAPEYTPPAPAAEPLPEPPAAPDPAPRPMQEPAPTPEPVATPAPESAPAPEPAPVPEPAPAPMPETLATPAPEPVAEPAPVAKPASAPAPTASTLAAVRGADELLSMAPGRFTIQLAAAASDVGFDALRQQLGLAAEETYAVRVRRDGGVWWLLLWRDFPDLASARAAAASLGGGYWPRRLAPLQAEVQAARAN